MNRLSHFLVGTLLAVALFDPPLPAAPLDAGAAFVYLFQFESYRVTPYSDGTNVCVGLGHNLTAHHESINRLYTHDECLAMFSRDFADALRACRSGITDFDTLPEDVQKAVLGVAFTCGPTGFHHFTNFRRALSHRFYNVAAHELAVSKWARQVSRERVGAALTTLQAH